MIIEFKGLTIDNKESGDGIDYEALGIDRPQSSSTFTVCKARISVDDITGWYESHINLAENKRSKCVVISRNSRVDWIAMHTIEEFDKMFNDAFTRMVTQVQQGRGNI